MHSSFCPQQTWRRSFLSLAIVVGVMSCLPNAVQATSLIALSSQPNQIACNLIDQAPGLRTVYVIQTLNSGSIASRFRVVTGPGSTLTYVSETAHFGAVGNTQSGISMCYGDCTAEDLLLVTISYMAYGTSLPCGQQQIIAHPAAQTVEIMNCGSVPERASVQPMFVEGPGGICGCPSPHLVTGTPQTFGCQPVPVSTSTWGAIKGLYARGVEWEVNKN